jgi:hypothetical protein
MCPEILLITGDFNFHLYDIADEDSRKFIEVLETFGLIQHVKFPTHIYPITYWILLSRDHLVMS